MSLESALWRAAGALRGEKDAPRFKDYLLPLVFWKRLSEAPSPEGELPPGTRWADVVPAGRPGLGERLTSALRAIARANPALAGVVDLVDFAEVRNGARELSDEALARAVRVLDELPLGDQDADVLGRAYEFLLRKFAEGAGQSAGEFFTPPEVSDLLALLARPGPGQTVHDPCCGSGGLLLRCHAELRARAGPGARLRLSGQELTGSTFALARMNVVLHGLEGRIARGNTLTHPAFVEGERLETFDVVVTNPMWNEPGPPASFYANDPLGRFGLGAPPPSTADWGWLQHVLAALSPSGRALVVLDAAAVSRATGDERAIRRAFVERDLVAAVILLPGNVFYNTTAQGIVVALDRRKPAATRGRVVLVDASERFARGRPRNVLDPSAFGAIAEAVEHGRAIPGLSAVATRDEVAARGFNLNPARWVARLATTPSGAPVESTERTSAQVRATADELARALAAPRPGREGWRTLRLGEVAELSIGRTPSRAEPRYWTREGPLHPWVTISDMSQQDEVRATREGITQAALDACFKGRLVPAGTLLMSFKLTIGRTSFLAVDAVHNEAIVALRPREDLALARFLFHLLPTLDFARWQDRAVKGQTLTRAKMEAIELVLPPLAEQRRALELLEAARRAEHAAAAHLTSVREARRELGRGLLE